MVDKPTAVLDAPEKEIVDQGLAGFSVRPDQSPTYNPDNWAENSLSARETITELGVRPLINAIDIVADGARERIAERLKQTGYPSDKIYDIPSMRRGPSEYKAG